MADRRYFWLKLPEDFFSKNKQIKRLRKIAGGDTYTIIYLKMLLCSLETNGMIPIDGLDGDIAKEISVTIEEDEDNVRITLDFLVKAKLAEIRTDNVYMTGLAQMVGSEGASAKRMRDSRSRQKALLSQCDNNVQHCHIEREIELEIEKDIDIEREIEREGNAANGGAPSHFIPPTIDQVKEVCRLENLKSVNPDVFYGHYQSINWKTNGEYLYDWKARLRKWDAQDSKKPKEKKNSFNNFQQREYDFQEYEKKFFGGGNT